ncbi:MAG: hypothetical protein PVG39_20640 [Desulfobacteraceae bacterium]|jgi:hypothetical protein
MNIRNILLSMFIIGSLTISGCFTAGTIKPGNKCGRECLINTLDSFLLAVAEHDPSHAPLAPDYRGTENAVDVRAGDGLWKSLTGLGDVQRRYADPASGQVGYIGFIKEKGKNLAIASVRLRIEKRMITESEWIIARKGMALYNPEGFAMNPPPETNNPDTSFPDRADAISIANSYFNGIDKSDGNLVIADPECYRIENGSATVGRKPEWPARSLDHSTPGDGITGPMSHLPDSRCTTGFDNLKNVTEDVINRRFFIDKEAGMVWANAIFKRVEGAKTSKGDILPWLYFNENFFIKDGHIRGIYAIMDYLPPEIKSSGWPDRGQH